MVGQDNGKVGAAESVAKPLRTAAEKAGVKIVQAYELESADDVPDSEENAFNTAGQLHCEGSSHQGQQKQQLAQQSGRKRKQPSKAKLLPHHFAAQHPEDFDLDVLRKRALLGLQVRPAGSH